jgi:hypothetical protein
MVSASKALHLAVFGAALLASVQSYATDNIFKSSEFLTWERSNQEFYIEASIGMASLVAAQNNKVQAKCIDDWYYNNKKASTDYILEIMRQNSAYHPRGVILATIEKKCQPLNYSGK